MTASLPPLIKQADVLYFKTRFSCKNVLKLTLNALCLYFFTFVEQSSTPSSMNESMEEEEAIPATLEKEGTPKLPLKVKKVYGDGQCLFRSVAGACDDVQCIAILCKE